MGLEDNQQREQGKRIAVSEDRLKSALYEFKDELFEKIDQEFATKTDVRWLVLTSLLGGPMIASLLTTAITRQTPLAQAQAIAHFATSLF
jgi:hypothetical protein